MREKAWILYLMKANSVFLYRGWDSVLIRKNYGNLSTYAEVPDQTTDTPPLRQKKAAPRRHTANANAVNPASMQGITACAALQKISIDSMLMNTCNNR